MFNHISFLERKMFQTGFVEKIKTQILLSTTFLFLPCHLWDVENIFEWGRIDDNITHVYCVPDT